MRTAARVGAFVAFALLASARTTRAQELEPRAYAASPLGSNFMLVAFGSSSGDVLFDPTIPITDVRAKLDMATAGYARTFGLRGLQGLVTAAVPYVVGNVEGLVAEEAREIRRSGLADARFKVSLNLAGTRAMTREEFAKAPRRTIFGVGLTVQAPTGQYDETKLINLGTRRWAFKPEIGLSVPVGPWFLEASGGISFFTTNDRFYPGAAVRRQDPLYALQAHAVRTFGTRAWLAADATWYSGGEATVDGGPPSTRQNNTRLGATFSVRVAKGHSLKVAASEGASARVGTDFRTWVVAWQLLWFDRG